MSGHLGLTMAWAVPRPSGLPAGPLSRPLWSAPLGGEAEAGACVLLYAGASPALKSEAGWLGGWVGAQLDRGAGH